jgi:hypothetical protein
MLQNRTFGPYLAATHRIRGSVRNVAGRKTGCVAGSLMLMRPDAMRDVLCVSVCPWGVQWRGVRVGYVHPGNHGAAGDGHQSPGRARVRRPAA